MGSQVMQPGGSSEDFMYAMKIENLLEPSEREKKQGITKKQPVPQS